jgi:NAD(P)-dependent dehydrogenase (short-subunit alcohol dehydrogenase family)
LAITRALLASDWYVVGMSRTYPGWALGNQSFDWVHADLRSGYGIETNRDRFGDHIDALINCAAIQGPIGLLDEVDYREWVEAVQTNLIGTYRVVRVALPYLERSEDGRILLFGGGGAFGPRPGYSAYAASKAGVVSLMETLAAEMETPTVNCVSPGFVPTPMTMGVDHASSEMDRAVACVLHLLSPAAKGLTGKTVSAEFDGWQQISQQTVPFLNASKMGTRERFKVWPLEPDGTYVYRTDANVSEGVLA